MKLYVTNAPPDVSVETVPTINGHIVNLGCAIEGHWGQYAIDQMTDIASVLGWHDNGENRLNPKQCRAEAELCEDRGDTHGVGAWWDAYTDAADKIEAWLVEHAVNCVPTWVDGEFFILSPDSTETEGVVECTVTPRQASAILQASGGVDALTITAVDRPDGFTERMVDFTIGNTKYIVVSPKEEL